MWVGQAGHLCLPTCDLLLLKPVSVVLQIVQHIIKFLNENTSITYMKVSDYSYSSWLSVSLSVGGSADLFYLSTHIIHNLHHIAVDIFFGE